MSILNFLKKIRLPSFEDEFIEDPVDEYIENVPLSQRQRVGGLKVVQNPPKNRESASLIHFETDYDDLYDTNPATGLPMFSATEDIGGHSYGSTCSD